MKPYPVLFSLLGHTLSIFFVASASAIASNCTETELEAARNETAKCAKERAVTAKEAFEKLNKTEEDWETGFICEVLEDAHGCFRPLDNCTSPEDQRLVRLNYDKAFSKIWGSFNTSQCNSTRRNDISVVQNVAGGGVAITTVAANNTARHTNASVGNSTSRPDPCSVLKENSSETELTSCINEKAQDLAKKVAEAGKDTSTVKQIACTFFEESRKCLSSLKACPEQHDILHNFYDRMAAGLSITFDEGHCTSSGGGSYVHLNLLSMATVAAAPMMVMLLC